MVKQLENNLKDVDLMSLQRIQVIEVLKRDFVEPEAVEQGGPAEEPGGSGECPGSAAWDSRTDASSRSDVHRRVPSWAGLSVGAVPGEHQTLVPQHFSGALSQLGRISVETSCITASPSIT